MKSRAYAAFRNLRHYPKKPSNNAIALKAGMDRRARRRRVLSIRKVTFEQLKQLLVDQVGQTGNQDMPGQSSIPNLISGMGDFIQDVGLKWTDPVGMLLRTTFERTREAHLRRLTDAGRSRPYVKNRAWLLNVWHRFLLKLDYEGASITGDLNPLQETLRPLFESGASVRQVAREIGVAYETLRSWLHHGRTPHPRNELHLERLEAHFCLEPGTLLGTLPRRRQQKADKDAPAIPHREKMRSWSIDRYRLAPQSIPPDHPIRAQWMLVVREKVEGKSSEVISQLDPVLADAFMIDSDKSWRTRPLREHWKEAKKMAKKWPQVLDGRWVPTAQRVFVAVSSYLGWLTLDSNDGGAGLRLQDISLGSLLDKKRILSYVNWITTRAGQVNSGHRYFIDVVLMLLNPKDGPFIKRPEIGEHVGYYVRSWHEECNGMYEWLLKEILPALKNGYKRHGMSRRPFIPIAAILELDRPLDAIIRGLNKAEAARPTTGAEHEVAWARDNALIALLASNPLRIENFITLTYKPDNTGHVRQSATGEWRIVIPKRELKNFRASAKDRDYDQAIDPAVVPFLVRYLRTYRPIIGGKRAELIFVSTDHPDREFDKLDQRVREWTRKYMDGVRSFGPHAFRHIVATHIIKTTSGNFVLAALALHDHPATVQKYYAHLLRRYADNARREAFAGSMSQLRTNGKSFRPSLGESSVLEPPLPKPLQ